MKHILICLICTVLLFGYIGVNTMGEDSNLTAINGNAVARVAAAATNQTPKKEATARMATVTTQVGLLLGHADDLGTARFKSAFEKSISTDIKLNVLDCAGSTDTQKTMFDKMLSSGYNLVVLELQQNSSAEYFIDKAGQAGIPLILTGQKPADALLTRYPYIYYLGFEESNVIDLLAQETAYFWNSNPTVMNFEKEKGLDLSYSAITTTGFEESGGKTRFEAALKLLDISAELRIDSVVRHYDYNLHKEIDNTIIKDSEIVFYDSSTEVQKVINYYYDPTEFTRRPKQQLALSVIDDGAAKLVADGEVLFACGTDTRELGLFTARVAQILLAGQAPSFQNVEREPVNERSFLLPYTMLRKELAPEPVAETK